MITFNIKLVNIVFTINAFNISTKRYCKDYLTDEQSEYEITLSEQDLKDEMTYQSDGKVYVNEEISALYRKIADILIERNIIVFHSSAFSVDGQAYLLAARSGVGKTTHARLLNEYLGDRFIYINDDKPLVKVDDDITVYSSPWNGKERRGNNISSPLKSVIFLDRGISNSSKRITNKESIYIKLLSQIYLPKEKSKREKALKIVDIILEDINFYQINVNTDISSAKMTYEEVIQDETE